MVIYGSCPNCGLQITVEEHAGNYTFIVGERAVTECPQCDEDLTYTGVTGREEEED